MKLVNKIYFSGTIMATIISLAISAPAFAQISHPASVNGLRNGQWLGQGQNTKESGMRPQLFGTVTSLNGQILTVDGRGFGNNAASTTYSVDASGATIIKNNATSTISDIAVGDKLMIQGTITGNNVSAKIIRDGISTQSRMGMNNPQAQVPHTPQFTGNGQPVVAGTVSSINGTSLGITTSSNTNYSVDASNSKIIKAGATSTLSSINSGDFIVVQGSISSSSVIASSIIDQQPHVTGSTGSASQNHPGFFGSIGNFFKSLFGF